MFVDETRERILPDKRLSYLKNSSTIHRVGICEVLGRGYGDQYSLPRTKAVQSGTKVP